MNENDKKGGKSNTAEKRERGPDWLHCLEEGWKKVGVLISFITTRFIRNDARGNVFRRTYH